MVKDSFSISFWFKDDGKREMKKSLCVFEGCDSGLFLSKGNELIGQIWNHNEKHKEIILSYARNVWNHCTFSYDNKSKKLQISVNEKIKELQLDDEFKLFDYTRQSIKISDEKTCINISDIIFYNSVINETVINLLYNRGSNPIDEINSLFGVLPSIHLMYNSLYKNQLILDNGTNKNHLRFYGVLNTKVYIYTE